MKKLIMKGRWKYFIPYYHAEGGYVQCIKCQYLVIFLVVLLMLSIFAGLPGKAVSANEPAGEEAHEQKSPYANTEISIRIIPAANNTFGYDILLQGRPFVHQPNIPGLPGNEGFSTRERAQKVAEFVVKKIRNSEMPPTVSREDLNRLNALP